MSTRHPLLTYLLGLLALSVILKITGIIEISTLEIAGYTLIFYGVSTVYLSLGKNRKAALFSGTVIFLLGVIFFLIGTFDFPNPAGIVIPSVMFIAGAGFLMLFIDDPLNSFVLIIIAAAFIILGISSTVITGTVDLKAFFNAAWAVTKRYWVVAIIIIALFFVLQKEKKE